MMTPQKIKNTYHFPGNRVTPSMSIEAESRQEAEAEYRARLAKGSAPITKKEDAPAESAEAEIKTK